MSTFLYLAVVVLATIGCGNAQEASPNGTVYTAVFLNSESRQRLIQFWNTTVPITSNLGKVYAEHMTLQFNPTEREVAALPKGKIVDIYGFLWSSDAVSCEGIQVYSPTIKSNNTNSHCTVSTGIATGAVCTNELLTKVHNGSKGIRFGYMKNLLKLTGCVDTFPPSGKCKFL